MSETPRATGSELNYPPEEQLNRPSKPVMWAALTAINLAMHSTTYFEEGAVEDLQEHRDNGGSLLLLMTHFRRWEPIVIADVARSNKPLRHIQYSTGITARSKLFDLPFPAGFVVRHSGSHRVNRSTENPNETPEERARRKEENRKTQITGGRFLARGLNWLIFPEGSSRETVEVDGQTIRIPRKSGEVLPLQLGFVYTLESMSEEERRRVKLLGIAVHYGDRRLSSLRPTVHVGRPVSPIEGTSEELRQQGEDILRHGVSEAVRLDALR